MIFDGLAFNKRACRLFGALVTCQVQTQGAAIVMATHDVELVATCAHRVALMAENEIVVDGPRRRARSFPNPPFSLRRSKALWHAVTADGGRRAVLQVAFDSFSPPRYNSIAVGQPRVGRGHGEKHK